MRPHNPRSRRRLIFIFGGVALVVAVIVGLRLHNAWALRDETGENALPIVAVIKAAQGPQTEEIILPGNVEAWHQATIYARTNGYLKRWLTPMGTPVKEGDLLAEIETPEVDSALRQAEADVKTAQANNMLAQSTAKRWVELLKTDSVSKQEVDEKVGDAAAKSAALASAVANRDRLRDMESFKRVVAPFDGLVTARLTDIGQLINAGSEQQQQPLFRMVQSDKLRIYVKVPQNYSSAINPDVVAELHFSEHPGKTYPASFLKSAEAIDPDTRTLLIEFKAENADSELFAGGYADVHIKLPTRADNVRLPVNTLIFRAAGLQIATVDANNHVMLKSITMGRDFGNTVEVLSGIEPDEQVIINPPDSLVNGQEVRIAQPKEKKNGDDKADKKETGDKAEEKK